MGIQEDGQATGVRDSEEILLQKRLEAPSFGQSCGESESRRSSGSSINNDDDQNNHMSRVMLKIKYSGKEGDC